MARLDFTAGLPSGVTVSSSPAGFARNSTATPLTSFSANAGRRTNLGIMLEPATTNGMHNGKTPGSTSNYSLINSFTTNTLVTAPDGTTTARRLATSSNPAGWYTIDNNLSGSVCRSLYFKPVSGSMTIWLGSDQTGRSEGYIKIVSDTQSISTVGTVTSYGVEAVGGGWYRCWCIYSTTYTNTILYMNGSGTVDIWGDQQENTLANNRPSSFIDSGASNTNRAADVVTWTVPAGVTSLTYTFDDGSTQVVSVSPGAYTFPTNLNRQQIKYVDYTSPGYTLAATTGSVPLTQVSTGLKRGFYAGVTKATMALTGVTAGTLRGFKTAVTQAAMALTPTPVGALYGRLLGVTKATMALTGVATGVLYKRVVAVTKASMGLAAQAVNLTYSGITSTYKLTITAASMALTAVSTGFKWTHVLGVTKAAMALTGVSTGTLYNRLLGATKAALALTAVSVNTVYGHVLAVTKASMALAATSVATFRGRALAVVSGALALTPVAVGTLRGYAIAVTQASVSLVQQGLNLLRIGGAVVAKGASLLIGL
jgi:hypothetical protein